MGERVEQYRTLVQQNKNTRTVFLLQLASKNTNAQLNPLLAALSENVQTRLIKQMHEIQPREESKSNNRNRPNNEQELQKKCSSELQESATLYPGDR
jgi:hypothetical protein